MRAVVCGAATEIAVDLEDERLARAARAVTKVVMTP